MEIKPTSSELEILQILWQKGASTVRQVNEELSLIRGEEVGYTTTLKLMQIMHEKGILERDTRTRTHVYRPLVNKERTRGKILNKFIDTVFNGSASQLVMQALSNRKASKEEIEQIRKYLDELDKN